ncbi:MAG: hypothetical protein OEX19_00445 [Gammaproteobacteria bacterium]|nr:hypothetical protein [Gammaproteobacteria bacterium]
MNRVTIYVILILSFSAAALTTAIAAEQNKAKVVEEVLNGTQGGRWQVIHIPQSWQKKYWKNTKFQSLYLALRGPHPDDLGNYAPCTAPSRILLGTENDEGDRKEYLLRCLDICSAQDNEKKVYRDLWARNTNLEGITAQLLQGGQIEVVEHFREILGVNRKQISDMNLVEKNRYGEEKRLRTHLLGPLDFASAIKQEDGSACMGRELNPPF